MLATKGVVCERWCTLVTTRKGVVCERGRTLIHAAVIANEFLVEVCGGLLPAQWRGIQRGRT